MGFVVRDLQPSARHLREVCVPRGTRSRDHKPLVPSLPDVEPALAASTHYPGMCLCFSSPPILALLQGS